MQSTAAEKNNSETHTMTTVASLRDQPHSTKLQEITTQPLPNDVVASLDAIQRTIALANARVVAITTPRSISSSTEISNLLARNIAASGINTLYIDATTPHPHTPIASSWLPGEPITDKELHLSPGNEPDRFTIMVTPTTRPLFNNLTRVQKTLQDDLRAYGSIIINLSPVLDADSKLVSPVSLARAAETVFLVCATGETLASDAAAAAELLRSANVTVGGTIMDNSASLPAGPEMAKRVENTRLLPTGLRTRLAAWLRTSELFKF
jgi:Mrp family chromosome partitioning ATPase